MADDHRGEGRFLDLHIEEGVRHQLYAEQIGFAGHQERPPISTAWTQEECPNQDCNVSKRELVALFRSVSPEFLMDEEERTAHQALEDTVTVYRGVTPYNAKNIRALSWTLDRKTADRFAHRFGEDGTVYEAQIRKEHILALFTGRNESEAIVDPRHLEQIMESPEPQFDMQMT